MADASEGATGSGSQFLSFRWLSGIVIGLALALLSIVAAAQDNRLNKLETAAHTDSDVLITVATRQSVVLEEIKLIRTRLDDMQTRLVRCEAKP